MIQPFLSESHSGILPGILIDATLGAGGHTKGFLEALSKLGLPHKVVALDQDERTCERARKDLLPFLKQDRLEIIHARFSSLNQVVALHQRRVLGCFADLGFSSDQLEDSTYGISFAQDGPLDMRLSQSTPLTCWQLLQNCSFMELKNILETFGEEPHAGDIAKAITRAKAGNELKNSTIFLRELVVQTLKNSQKNPPQRSSKIHPATLTFQALRIAVNGELSELSTLLGSLPQIVTPGGHVGFLSFHSLEDRLIKSAFANTHLYTRLNKKPIIADTAEVRENPRSRSAKLRVAKRV
jgi:16S rRNA (cytosine1402-N4)-methyltransferase